MYYSDYKKKNGYSRKDERHSNYGEQRNASYYRSGARYSSQNEGRYGQHNSYSGYDVNSYRYNNDDRYENRNRNHGGYYNENYGSSYERDRDRGDERNMFERAGDRIRQGWNNMTHDDDHHNDYLKSRHNGRQAGYDNGDHRNRPYQDEEYGYHHQRASNGYAGDNRTYNSDYENRYDNRNPYLSSGNNDNYYTGYHEFDRNDARRREDRWRGRSY